LDGLCGEYLEVYIAIAGGIYNNHSALEYSKIQVESASGVLHRMRSELQNTLCPVASCYSIAVIITWN